LGQGILSRLMAPTGTSSPISPGSNFRQTKAKSESLFSTSVPRPDWPADLGNENELDLGAQWLLELEDEEDDRWRDALALDKRGMESCKYMLFS